MHQFLGLFTSSQVPSMALSHYFLFIPWLSPSSFSIFPAFWWFSSSWSSATQDLAKLTAFTVSFLTTILSGRGGTPFARMMSNWGKSQRRQVQKVNTSSQSPSVWTTISAFNSTNSSGAPNGFTLGQSKCSLSWKVPVFRIDAGFQKIQNRRPIWNLQFNLKFKFYFHYSLAVKLPNNYFGRRNNFQIIFATGK